MTTGQVIVAGSGASGLVAALAAAAGGADVLVLERSELLGGTTALGGGRVWVPANHCPENAGDSAEAARTYLGGLFPARYAHLTEAFVANAPAMARFVEERSPHRFAACPAYPDYHPERAGATAGGRCLDMELADLSAMAPQARQVRVPPGYLPMTQAEWEGWRFPCRFDWKLLRQREAAGLRANGVALAAALADGVLKAGGRIETGARLTGVTTGPDGTVTPGVAQQHRDRGGRRPRRQHRAGARGRGDPGDRRLRLGRGPAPRIPARGAAGPLPPRRATPATRCASPAPSARRPTTSARAGGCR